MKTYFCQKSSQQLVVSSIKEVQPQFYIFKLIFIQKFILQKSKPPPDSWRQKNSNSNTYSKNQINLNVQTLRITVSNCRTCTKKKERKRSCYSNLNFNDAKLDFFPLNEKKIAIYSLHKVTCDFDDTCCTPFLAAFVPTCWLAKSARMLSKDHNTKEPSASIERWLIQSTDVL